MISPFCQYCDSYLLAFNHKDELVCLRCGTLQVWTVEELEYAQKEAKRLQKTIKWSRA